MVNELYKSNFHVGQLQVKFDLVGQRSFTEKLQNLSKNIAKYIGEDI